ncbi:MAG TPA: hypothetical protein PKZ07_14740 [Sedimentisphaerales bacterium]|nr:hypothetical protein [Sedimentisphaerales bacterium]
MITSVLDTVLEWAERYKPIALSLGGVSTFVLTAYKMRRKLRILYNRKVVTMFNRITGRTANKQYLDDAISRLELLHQKQNQAMQEQIKVIASEVKQVKYQLTPNGGGNFFGKIERVEQEVREIRGHQMAREDLQPDPVIYMDLTGSVQHVNLRWMHITGRAMHEHRNDGWLNSIHEDDVQYLSDRISESCRGKRNIITQRPFRVINNEGDVVGSYNLEAIRTENNYYGVLRQV